MKREVSSQTTLKKTQNVQARRETKLLFDERMEPGHHEAHEIHKKVETTYLDLTTAKTGHI